MSVCIYNVLNIGEIIHQQWSELGSYVAGDLENYGLLNLGPTGKTLDASKKFKDIPIYR
jgi:hypothetical protein